MILEHIPVRYRTASMARAVTSPGSLLLAGVATSVAIVAGAPIAGAAVVGGLAFAGRAAWSGRDRGTKAPTIELGLLQPPWRAYVADADDARRRFRKAVANRQSGPLRDRLQGLAQRIDDGLQQCFQIARQAMVLDEGVNSLDIDRARRELAILGPDDPKDQDSASSRTRRALNAQIASHDRLDKARTQARDRLVLLNAQLDEIVARTVELSLQSGESGLGGLDQEVEGMVTELESLRQALDETSTVDS